MRFERIRVRAFGALTELDTGAEPLGSLVVVQAPNEGGKSTFFALLSSLLYGFYPASRDRHPYAPWSGADADADAEIDLSGGARVTVHRRLLASPWGRLIRDGEEEDLANRTVPWASHVRRVLFGEVFALTLADLARVDEERWPEIQDRLLGSMGADDVRGAREVVAELEEEAKQLWRPDRMGKPRAGELRERLTKLHDMRREAARRDREARQTARDLEARRQRLEAGRRERREARALLVRARTLGPVRRQLQRIREQEARAGDPEELKGLPGDPAGRLAELRREEGKIGEELEAKEAEVQRLRERAEALTGDQRTLLRHGAEIRELGKLAGTAGAARDRLATLDERVESLERRVREGGRELFDRPWSEVDGDAVRRFPLKDLRSRIGRYRDAAREAASLRERAGERERRGPGPAEEGWGILGPGLLAAGTALALWAWTAELGVGFVAAGMAAAFAGGLLLVQRREARRSRRARRREHREALGALRSELQRAERAAADARDAVAEATEGLLLAEAHLEAPRPELVHVLERLQDHLEDVRQVRGEASALRNRVEDVRRRADALLRDVEMEAPEEVPARVATLERALEDAEKRRADARSAEEALEQAERAVDRLREELEEVHAERAELEERLSALGGDELERGTEEARARVAALEKARVLREELERQHPDLEELRRRIREAEESNEDWTMAEEAVVAAEERENELEEEEKEFIEEINDLEHELRQLQEGRTLDRVEGEILAVEEELDELRRQRDRLALLARIIGAADHRFRERNQPDLLKAAGRHISTVTDGRYRRLLMPERDLDGTLLLQGPGYPGPVEVDTPISTGTREQVYLALRLAIVDHLDADGERLPLFLDEAFVNWDEERRERGFELLADLAGDRQIFVFTCHRPMARSLADRGARLLDLGEPE